MKDRIPAPGKANRVRITRDDGQAVEGALSYVDDAIQAGSRYTKQNVLPDDVCDALNIDRGGAEPKDAFNACWAVGDIKTTARASLGANWHACDGSNFVAADLPELSAIIEPSIERGFAQCEPFNSSYTVDVSKYVNGIYVVLGHSDNQSVIGFTDSFAHPWATAQWGYPPTDNMAFVDIIYDGTRYIALASGRGDHQAGESAYVAYATQPAGPWIWVNTGISSSYAINAPLHYSGGRYFFVYASRDDRPYIATATAINGEWSTIDATIFEMGGADVEYLNGLWVLCGTPYGGSSRGCYAFAVNPTSADSWTYVGMNDYISCILNINGTLVMGGDKGKIWYTANPKDGWTEKTVISAGHGVRWLSYPGPGKLVAIADTSSNLLYAAEAAAPSGPWREYYWSFPVDADAEMVSASHNGVIAIGSISHELHAYGYSEDVRNYPRIELAEPAKAFIRMR